jgi:hypothetical protein
MLPRALGAAALLCASTARAEAPELPGPELPDHSPREDTRFGTVGRGAPEANETLPAPAFGVGSTQLGHVTYASVRADVPVARTLSLIPQAALLRVAPYRATDPATINTYAGGGVVVRPASGWAIEATSMIGPRANQISSVGFALGASADFGADWAHDRAPPLSLDMSMAGTRFDWANGLGPAGANVMQLYALAQATARLGSRLTLQPRGMYFLYDKPLDDARGERLGTVSTLARVGSYAPRWMAGGRVGYQIASWLTPFAEAEEIGYAAGIGHGTKVAGGVRVHAGPTTITALGGAILNRVGGPLVPTEFDLRTVPLVGLEAELAL